MEGLLLGDNGLIEYASDLYCFFNLKGQLAYANRSWYEKMGYSLTEATGLFIKDIVHPDHEVQFNSIIKKAIDNKTVNLLNVDFLTKGSHHLPLTGNVKVKFDCQKQIIGTELLLRVDNETIKQSSNINEHYYKTIVETSQDGFWVLGKNHNIIDVNEAYCQMIGYSREEILALKIDDVEADESSQQIQLHIEEVSKKGTAFFETRQRRKDRTLIDVEVSVSLLSNDPLIVVCFCRDITAKKREQKETYSRNAFLQGLFDNVSSGIAIYEVKDEGLYGKDYIIKDFNRAALKIEGKTRDEVVGKSLFDLRPTIDDYGLIQVFRNVWKTGRKAFYPIKLYIDEKYTSWYANQVFKLPTGEIIAIYDDVTEQKLAEEALRKSEEKHRILFETMSQGVIYQNTSGEIISVNPAAEKLLGLTIEEMRNRTSMHPGWQTISEDGSAIDGSEHPAMIALRSGKPVGPVTMGVYNPQKEDHLWFSISATPLFKPGESKPYQVYATINDITQNKIANEIIKVSEEKYRLLVTQMQLGLAFHEIITEAGKAIDYRFISVNKKFEQLTGLKAKDLIGKTVLEVMPNTEQYWIDTYGKVALTGEPFQYENYSVELNKWFKVSAYSPKPGQFAVLVDDITERKSTEQELKETLARLNALLDNSPSAIMIIDENGRYVEVSAAAEKIIGLPRENIIGKCFHDLLPQNIANEFLNTIAKIQKNGKQIRKTDTLLVDGKQRILESRIFPIETPDNKYVLFGSIANDITEQKQMENLLHLEKEQFKTTLLSVGDGVISTDKYGNILVMNQIAENLTGWTQKEAYGKPLEEVLNIINEFSREPCVNPAQKVMKTGKIVDMANHTMLIAKNGKEIPIEDSAAPIKDSTGKASGVVIVFRDYTEKKEKINQIEYLSFHDHLTGLYNRRYIEDAIARLNTASNLPFTIIVSDVNGLKLTNDAFGHSMGDRLLQEVANIMRNVCNQGEIIGRMGGDEFYILLPQTDESQAEIIKQKMIASAAAVKLDSAIVSLAVGYAEKKCMSENIENVKINAENNMYKDKIKYGKTMRSQTIETVLRNINFKYDYEQLHTERVSQYCEIIAIAMNFSDSEIQDIKNAGILHDIGKIVVPPELLNKPGKLTKEEFDVVKRHPEISYQILKSVDEYAALAEDVLHHHERWDGTGYPSGLKGEEIALYSRIIAVADAYEAMTARRSYQSSKNKKEALAELIKHAGTQFDPEIVAVFVDIMGK